MHGRLPRRLPPERRRRQLVECAIELFAEAGYGEVRLEDVAQRAAVSPSLVYHYFPGRARELHLDAVRHACQQGLELLDTDLLSPLEHRQLANLDAYLDHVLDASPAYLLLSRARASADPDVQAELNRARHELVARIALNNLGTTDPGPAVALAIGSYLEFLEAACRQWQANQDMSRNELLKFLARTLTALIAAAPSPDER